MTLLLICEGKILEEAIIESLRNCFNLPPIIYSSFGTSIYKLYQEVSSDADLDILTLVKQYIRKRKNSTGTNQRYDDEILQLKIDELSDTFLLFDYDPHCSNADNSKVQALLSTFNDSQDKGSLLISYPMVESLWHITEKNDPLNFITCPICKSQLKNYKKTRKENMTLPYLNSYDKDLWHQVIKTHLLRAHFIVSAKKSLPEKPISQATLFAQQQEKFIIPNDCVAVVSAFPLLLYDYYGQNLFSL